ncbi:cyanase [Amorphus orientalis]|uniref:Cyanate hydratase n=1 Tax=Amorphus orientalis TaxID=649198 RepID=A0AAE3VPP5_9HYPH|nr:cyanase [Amorphus orientalis]MDQ0315753.1 cyanate lyase [Amorphus orientalis]
MKRSELTEKILDYKRDNDLSWKEIADGIGGYTQLFIMTALLGNMKLPKPQAAKAAKLFGLSKSEEKLLNEVPMRCEGAQTPPTDPTLYRFYEAMLVFGPTMKEFIHEEFGDGIMSAIDFDLEVERQPDPKGDRVRVVMSGKFLPYKYHGAQEGQMAYGLKEE